MIIYFDLEIFLDFEKDDTVYPWYLEKFSGHKIKSIYMVEYDEHNKSCAFVYKNFEPFVDSKSIDEFIVALFDKSADTTNHTQLNISNNTWISYESHFYLGVIKALCFRYNKLIHLNLLEKIKFNDLILSNDLEEKRSSIVLEKKKYTIEYQQIIEQIINYHILEKSKCDSAVKSNKNVFKDKIKKMLINIGID